MNRKVKGIKLHNIDTTLENVLDLLHNEKDGYKYELNLSTPTKDHFRVDIVKVIHNCFICKNEHHKKDLLIRQDKRVTKLFLPKKVCKNCIDLLDDVLDRLKTQAIPKHLSKLG